MPPTPTPNKNKRTPKKDCMGFPGGSVMKNQLSMQGCRSHGFEPWVRKIPWRRKWQPTPVFLLGESHGQRSLVGTVHGVTICTCRRVCMNPSMVLGKTWRGGVYMTFSLHDMTLLPSWRRGGVRTHLTVDKPIQTGLWDPDSPTKPVLTETTPLG